MSDWRIRERYGYGAARIILNPDPPREPQPLATLAAGLRAIAAELASEGWSGNLRNALSTAPVLGFLATLALALMATMSREPIDTTDLEIVQLEPERLPAPQELSPEPEPEPEVLPEPEPEVQIARAPEPPPPVPPPARPKLPEPPAPPKPVEHALPKPPPPRPVEVARRSPPRVSIDALPERPERAPAPVARTLRPEPEPQRPALAPPPPLAIDPVPPKNPLLAATRAPLPERVEHAPSRPPQRTAPPKLALAPMAPLDVPEERTPQPLPTRAPRIRAEPVQTARAAPPKVSFDLSAPPASAAPAPESARTLRVARAEPAAQPARRSMPKALTPVGAISTSSRGRAQANPTSNRTERVAPEARSRSYRLDDDRLEAVALSSLAACRSDREEEELKLEVMGAIGGRQECSSSAGRYRFVETKNLNAFLMWIERAPNRKEADRCVELRLTLECLRGTGR